MTTPSLLAEAVGRSVSTVGSRFTLTIDRFEVAAGARVAIVGPSGCGKSTLLGLVSLALRPDAGQVLRLVGTDALSLWRQGAADALGRLRARHLGFVAQTGALLPFLTVRRNITLTQQLGAGPDPTWIGHLAERLGIASLMDRMPHAISVGERQRAAIARALAHRPDLVLADEPTASVHPAQADAILGLLSDIAEEQGTALVITTHDAGRAAAAGFALAPCELDTAAAATRFAWP